MDSIATTLQRDLDGSAATLPGDWDEEDTVVDLVPAGALASCRTLPLIGLKYLGDVATETRVFLAGVVGNA